MALILKLHTHKTLSAMKEITKKAIARIAEELGAWTTLGLLVFAAVKLIETIF